MPKPSRPKIPSSDEYDSSSLTQAEKANLRAKKWFDDNKARRYAYIKSWNAKNKSKVSGYQKKYKTKLRKQVIGYYSAYTYRCACCHEKNWEFLTIDHIENNGAEHRRELGIKGGHRYYNWLINNNFPKGYRVLCANCNHSLGVWGYCPHNKMPQNTTIPL